MQRKQIKNYTSSPLNYIGGKARILDQMLPFMPTDIDIFVDLFCGGCNVGMNVSAGYTIYNDTSKPLISLIKALKRMKNETIIKRINELIDEFEFSRTRNYPRKDNQYYILLYTLILFGFNNQLRFNDNGEFNLPVGKRDFNTAIEAKLVKFLDALRLQDCEFQTKDFRKFDFNGLTQNSLVYCDPPYLITTATYNEKDGWNEQDERDLLDILDNLSRREIRFALSNVLQHEGKENTLLKEWIELHNYNVHELFMDYHYSNYQKKSKKAESQEVLITNY